MRMLILRFFAGFCEFSRVLKNFYCEFSRVREFLRVFASFREFSRIFAKFREFCEFSRVFASFREFFSRENEASNRERYNSAFVVVEH